MKVEKFHKEAVEKLKKMSQGFEGDADRVDDVIIALEEGQRSLLRLDQLEGDYDHTQIEIQAEKVREAIGELTYLLSGHPAFSDLAQ